MRSLLISGVAAILLGVVATGCNDDATTGPTASIRGKWLGGDYTLDLVERANGEITGTGSIWDGTEFPGPVTGARQGSSVSIILMTSLCRGEPTHFVGTILDPRTIQADVTGCNLQPQVTLRRE